MLSKKLIALTVLIAILGGALLTACAGGASIDVNVDPETGQGTIDIIGSGEGGGESGNSGGMTTNNVIILAVVVALFLAIIALVIALVGRRPNP
ncbi:MAG: hypothetical protein KF698_04985 [Anaerolineales bacterium]|nr:hypothetical protein [Anaerolineales bacterium]